MVFPRCDGAPVLVKQSRVEFIDDGPGGPLGVNRFIGRRPIAAFGDLAAKRSWIVTADAAGRPFSVRGIERSCGLLF